MTLDATAGREAKERGMQLAIEFAPEWRHEVVNELRAWLLIRKSQGHSTMTMEQFRAVAKTQPASHKAWGPLSLLAAKDGLIRQTMHPDGSPVYRPAASVKTHAHPVKVWCIA